VSIVNYQINQNLMGIFSGKTLNTKNGISWGTLQKLAKNFI